MISFKQTVVGFDVFHKKEAVGKILKINKEWRFYKEALFWPSEELQKCIDFKVFSLNNENTNTSKDNKKEQTQKI